MTVRIFWTGYGMGVLTMSLLFSALRLLHLNGYL